MPAQILDGRAIAARICEEVREEIKKLGRTPGLAVILVGDDPASHLYVSLKEKAAAEVGIRFEKYLFPASVSQEKIVQKITTLNARDDIDALIVQLPLPTGFDTDTVIRAIRPTKDVDGFHPENLALLLEGKPRVIPPVARAVDALLRKTDSPLVNKRAALLVKSHSFAAPLEYLLEKRDALVHIVLAPRDLKSVLDQLRISDIVIVAIGRPRAVTGDMIKDGAVIIDVGTNRLPDGTLVGDVDFESVKEKAGWFSPVPGGVGPLTVAMLLKNVVSLARQAH